jgi:damage-control phosphatase, subfamily I
MHIWSDCVPCILKMAAETCRLSGGREEEIKRMMEEILKLKPLRGEFWNITSPEIIRDAWNMITERFGQDDPLKKIKDEQNRKALQAYPRAKEIVNKSEDPFLTALKLSIEGNAFDAMMGAGNDPTEGLTAKLDSLTINPDHVETLKERLARSAHVLWFSDNCGEIVFDRLFVETMRRFYKVDIVYVTRTVPILNDATLTDAEFVGIGNVATLMENGIQEPIAGTILAKTASTVRELVEKADLLISKGVGNYDSLTEESEIKGKISYLFHAKCHPCCASHNVKLGDLIVFNS